MDEEGKVKKQLVKNIIINLITFSIIFYLFGTVIYSQFYNSLYISADSELETVINQANKDKENLPRKQTRNNGEVLFDIAQPEDLNPRLVFIYRNVDGEILENFERNNYINSLFTDVDFDEDNLNTIYEMNINNEYWYRAINCKTTDGNYVQVLINVDAEKDIANKFKQTLIIAIVICVILILIASYILSRRTLDPIIVSWKKQTEFVQNASHELRTPLAIIKAKQEHLLEKPDSKIIDNAEDISITLKETQRLTKLIKELMELARNDSNELKLNKEKFKLDGEIESLTSLYADVAKSQKKNLSLDLQYDDIIYADCNKLKELLIILLDNSLKYTEEKDSIVVKTYKRENKCFIEVIDSGIGISKEDQDHIFERFYRAEKSRARESGGMGLGLSIAYNIVKAHKGFIRVDKNMVNGTRIIVRLPVK